MTPTQIKQALTIRMLRADKAERALGVARDAETQALQAVQAIDADLAAFDASFQARLDAFYASASAGTRPELLHSARSFHSDLAGERAQIEALRPQARQVVDLARKQVIEARRLWAAASSAADNLKTIHTESMRLLARKAERLAEQDADELAVARMRRSAG